MSRLKRLNGVAAGLASSFVSRNNDVGGYWVLGLLKTFALEHRLDPVTVQLIPVGGNSDPLLETIASTYRTMLERLLATTGLSADSIKLATISTRFNLAEHEAARAWPPRRRRDMRNLLWVDCTAALLAGATVLSLSGWLARLYQLPRSLLLLIGIVNLLYGSYSFALASRAKRPKPLIIMLVLANSAWALVCTYVAVLVARSATGFAMAHLVGEALLVGGLAALEWRWRDQLVTAAWASREESG